MNIAIKRMGYNGRNFPFMKENRSRVECRSTIEYTYDCCLSLVAQNNMIPFVSSPLELAPRYYTSAAGAIKLGTSQQFGQNNWAELQYHKGHLDRQPSIYFRLDEANYIAHLNWSCHHNNVLCSPPHLTIYRFNESILTRKEVKEVVTIATDAENRIMFSLFGALNIRGVFGCQFNMTPEMVQRLAPAAYNKTRR